MSLSDAAPNNGMQATASSVRSCLAAAPQPWWRLALAPGGSAGRPPGALRRYLPRHQRFSSASQWLTMCPSHCCGAPSPPGGARTSRPGWQAGWGRVPGWGQRAGPCWRWRPGPAAPPAESGPACRSEGSPAGQWGVAVALRPALLLPRRAAGGACRAGLAAPGPGRRGLAPRASGAARGSSARHRHVSHGIHKF